MYTAISRKVFEKNVHATIPKGLGYDQYSLPNDCSCRTYFCCFPLALANTFLWPFVPILSNFFEKQRTQNHPQCLSGLSHALFPTTFLEIAVFKFQTLTCQNFWIFYFTSRVTLYECAVNVCIQRWFLIRNWTIGKFKLVKNLAVNCSFVVWMIVRWYYYL